MTDSQSDWKTRLNAVSSAQAKHLWALLILGVFYLALDARVLRDGHARHQDIRLPLFDLELSTALVWASGPAVLFLLLLVIFGSHRAYRRAEQQALTQSKKEHSEPLDESPNPIDLAVYTAPQSPKVLQRLLRFTYPTVYSLFTLEALYLLYRLCQQRQVVPAAWPFLIIGLLSGLVVLALLLLFWKAQWGKE